MEEHMNLLKPWIGLFVYMVCLGALGASSVVAGTSSIDTEAEFASAVNSNSQPKVLLFTADWCTYCHKIKPSFDTLANDYDGNADFYVVNFDGVEQTRNSYDVKYIPTMIFIQDGKEVDRVVGYAKESTLRTVFERNLSE